MLYTSVVSDGAAPLVGGRTEDNTMTPKQVVEGWCKRNGAELTDDGSTLTVDAPGTMLFNINDASCVVRCYWYRDENDHEIRDKPQAWKDVMNDLKSGLRQPVGGELAELMYLRGED